jgi:nitroreductase
MTDSVTSFSDLAHRRRSNLRIDPERPVDPELLEQLITVAATAPNHYRTHPWRFRIITGAGREGLGESLAAELRATAGFDPVADEAKIAKARSKYLRAPVMVVVASRAGDDPIATLENRDAVAAAIQTLLLAATAAGLASLWSTGAAATSAEVARFCGFDPSDSTVGLIYLGWPTVQLEAIERPAPEIVHIDRA